MMVPPGLKNLAKDAKLTSSDKNATSSVLEKITDGDKEASDQSIISCAKAVNGCKWIWSAGRVVRDSDLARA